MAVKPYILAARPKTLPAAIVPVFLGCALAWRLGGIFDLWLAVCTLMGAIFIQISTNFFNDAIDNDKGADTEQRLGPVRASASGLLSRRAVYGFAIVCLLLAAGFGWFLYDARGWVMIAIGVPSFYLCYGYTGGPIPLAYRGLGELFVILFFGVVAVMGTVFVQLGEWRWEALLLGLQVGLLSAALISINNLRDRQEDAKNNKRTLAVKLGERVARTIILAELVLPVLLGFGWLFFSMPSATLLPSLYFMMSMGLMRDIQMNPPGKIYNRFLARAGVQLILFATLFSIACLL